MADKTKILVTTLIALVVVMATILAYVFLIQPTLTGKVVEGQNLALESIVLQVAPPSCQPITLNLGDDGGGQQVNIIAAECFPNRFPELGQQQQGQAPGPIEEQIEETEE